MNNQSKQSDNKLLSEYTSHTDYPDNIDASTRCVTVIDYTPNKVIIAVVVVCLIGAILWSLIPIVQGW